MDEARDILLNVMPNSNQPREAGRTKLQAVLVAEGSWLQRFLVDTDVYICPSEATLPLKKVGI